MEETTVALTQADKVLASACAIETQEFSLERLVVACWQHYPDTFGLAGFRQYPDSHRVVWLLCGKAGLVAKGFLVRSVGEEGRAYSVSDSGRRRAAELGRVECVPLVAHAVGKPRLGQRKSTFVKRWLASDAWYKFCNDKVGYLSFADAANFWGGPLSGFLRADKQAGTELILTEIEQFVGDDGEIVTTHGRVVSAVDVRNLRHLHSLLKDRFGRRLAAS